MAPLTKDVELVQELGNVNEIGVLAAKKIFEGAAVSLEATGFAQGLVAGEKFLGFAESQANNSAGLDGAIKVRVLTRGRVKLAVASLAIDDVGKAVYASEDGTFLLTQSTNTFIGRVTRFISSGVGVVAFNAEEGATFGAITLSGDMDGADTVDEAALETALLALENGVNSIIRLLKR